MRIKMQLEKFLEFENSSNILNYHFSYKNILIWPFIRFFLIRGLCEKEYLNKNLRTEPFFPQINPIHDVYRSFIKNPYFSSQKDLIFLYAGRSNFKGPDNRYHHNLFDFYAKLFSKNTMLLEETIIELDNLNRDFQYVYYTDFIKHAVNFYSSNMKVNSVDQYTINLIIDYLKKNLREELDRDLLTTLKNLLEQFSKSIPAFYSLYNLLFRKLKPKLVFIEDACYGYHNAIKLKVLHDLKIKTAEFQHGWIGKKHEGYNYSNFLYHSKIYRDYLPNYLLTFGSYWNNQMKVPVKKVVIGSANVKYDFYYKKKKNTSMKTILFAATLEHKSYINLLTKIYSQNKNNFKIIFKLHPLDNEQTIDKYRQFEKHINFEIAYSKSLYDYLYDCDYLITDFSTVLYEAVAIGKRVLILVNSLSNYYQEYSLGKAFQTASEFFQLINDENWKNSINGKDLYNQNTKENYTQFLKNLCIIK